MLPAALDAFPDVALLDIKMPGDDARLAETRFDDWLSPAGV